MTDAVMIAFVQTNPTVGAVATNLELLRQARRTAAAQGADLLVTSELAICGYPPEDLIRKPAFLAACADATALLARETADGGPAVLLGAPFRPEADSGGTTHPDLDNPTVGLEAGRLYNCAMLLDGGKIAAVRAKHALPNYGVFDEKRVFDPGPLPGPIGFRGLRLGAMVCEDMWIPDVAECLEESGAELLVVLNGSPWDIRNAERRMQQAVARVTETGLPLLYVNQTGGQDELVFDGASFFLNADRNLAVQAPSFRTHLETVTLTEGPDGRVAAPGALTPPPDESEAVWRALVMGLGDYVEKNRFPGVVLGLSGGIDSALAAALACDALGPDRVHCVMMPYAFTSSDSLEDAEACAKLLGVRYDIVPIAPAVDAFAAMTAPLFGDRAPDVTEENVQSRSRGLTLMAISNKLGAMVLSTGNKSEMSVGYATLYGDMCGGYAVLKDVYKTRVTALSAWRNRVGRPDGMKGPDGPVMPQRIIDKPPTAELRADQKDEDSLPAYDRLDAILQALIEDDAGVEEIVAAGHDRDEAVRVWRLLELAEYKRRQAPPGVKITPRTLSRERRYPIVNGFKGPA